MFTPRPTVCDVTMNTEFPVVLARRRLAVKQDCHFNCSLQQRVFCNDEASAEECGKEQFLHLHRALSARGPEAGTVTPSRRADVSSTQSPYQHRYRSDYFGEALLHEDAADQRCVSCSLELARSKDLNKTKRTSTGTRCH